MSRVIVVAFILALLAVRVSAATVKAPEAPTQQVFAKQLIEVLGWGEGLPEKPQDRDLLTILSGKRSFRFEAEDHYDQKYDAVSVRNYPLFGAFSGSGWVHGTTVRTAVHFKLFIPVEGKYLFKVTAKGDDQLWSIAGKAFKLDSGTSLKESAVGEVTLNAGVLEFNAVIPPSGAIDSFSLTAPDLRPIEPVNGWDFAALLTPETVNETAAVLLNLENRLPEDSTFQKTVIEAATATTLPPEAILTDNQVYGKTLAARWVRLPQKEATVSLPFKAEQTAVYTLKVRTLGEKLIAGFDNITALYQGKPYLDWVDIGAFKLEKGMHAINIHLPAAGGIDALEVGKKLTSAKDYATLTKLDLPRNRGLKTAEMDTVLKVLQEQFKERK